jgi:hypothetical protein
MLLEYNSENETREGGWGRKTNSSPNTRKHPTEMK